MSKNDIENGMVRFNEEGEAEEYCLCSICGNWIFYGDEYYDMDGEKICADCIEHSKRRAS